MSVQIAVKLPDALLAEVDALVAAGTFSSRSAAVRAGIEAITAAARRRDVDQAFREGFRRRPDTPGELADAHRLAIESIEEEPWEPWW